MCGRRRDGGHRHCPDRLGDRDAPPAGRASQTAKPRQPGANQAAEDQPHQAETHPVDQPRTQRCARRVERAQEGQDQPAEESEATLRQKAAYPDRSASLREITHDPPTGSSADPSIMQEGDRGRNACGRFSVSVSVHSPLLETARHGRGRGHRRPGYQEWPLHLDGADPASGGRRRLKPARYRSRRRSYPGTGQSARPSSRRLPGRCRGRSCKRRPMTGRDF